MHRLLGTISCAVLALLAIGCGGGEPPAAAGNNKQQQASNTPAQGPDQAVYDFLEAVRTADEEKAAAMLTDLARQKTAAQGMTVAPPGSDTARFEVKEVDTTVGPGAAHVGCLWTDVDEEGHAHTDKIVWILHEEGGQWRIAGMATKVFEDQPPLFLNFEDPEDMLRKQELVQEEMMRRADQESRQARQPGETGGPALQ